MKKIFFFLMATIGLLFTACNNGDDDNLSGNYTDELVGTWTCLVGEYAEALVFSADGKVLSTGIEDGEMWEDVKGSYKVNNNKLTMTFEDNDNFDGTFSVVKGYALSIVDGKTGEETFYHYCNKDLNEEILGSWICNDVPSEVGYNIVIQTYNENGTILQTGYLEETGDYILNASASYKVVGDLLFMTLPDSYKDSGYDMHAVSKMLYSPTASLGDVMTFMTFYTSKDISVADQVSFLRIREELNLTGKYNFSKLYVSNVKGKDKDIDFVQDYVFNFAKMDGSMLSQILKTILFYVEFPDANTFKYGGYQSNQWMFLQAPIEVDGNKVTVKMSTRKEPFRDIELYVFQDADECQMHIYLPTHSFINFYGNMQVQFMLQMGTLNADDTEAIEAIYHDIDDVVDSINLSFVLKK